MLITSITWSLKKIHRTYHSLSLLHRNASIQPAKSPVILPTHPTNEVQSLGVVGYDHDLVTAISWLAHLTHETPQDKHLPRQFRMDWCIPSTTHSFVGHEFGNAICSGCGSALRLFFCVADLLLVPAASALTKI